MAIGYLSTATRTLIKSAMKRTHDTFAQSSLVLQIPCSVIEDYPYQESVTASSTNITLSCVKYINPRDAQQFGVGQSIDCDAVAQLWVADMQAAGLTCTIAGMDALTKAIAILDGESFEVERGELLDGNIIAGEFFRCNLYLNRINSRRR